MAKVVECHLSDVSTVLDKHAKGWLLVAVIARRRPSATLALEPEWKWEEWRELYFEREPQ